MAPRKTETRQTVWWLTGSESCPHCMQVYVYEAEYRCAGCDDALCPCCVIVIDEIVLCPSCAEAEATDGDAK